MQVRDYAPAGSTHRSLLDPPIGAINLGVRHPTTIPAGARAQRVELDLAIDFDGSLVALIVPDPAACLAADLRATFSPVVVGEADPLAPLSMWLDGGADDAYLVPGMTIARLLLTRYEAPHLYPDPELDHRMASSAVLEPILGEPSSVDAPDPIDDPAARSPLGF